MDFKQIVSAIAPFLGTMIGGPVGGAAMSALSRALFGKEGGTEQEIQEALGLASPETRVKLRQIEAELKLEMEKAVVESNRIDAMDRDSARAKEIATKDWMPAILATVLTLGLFGILFALIFYPVQSTMVGVLNVMLGFLGTAWGGAMQYYFGSSSGSKMKTRLLKG